ncbi:MAG: NFACT family protein, partial [Candidatus Methanofastidiosia archaeon]
MIPMFSSFDVYEMIKELKEDRGIVGMRVKTIYEIPKANEVRFKLFGRGRRDLVISKNCFYLTRYPKKAPMKATSFAMFLRKRLKGLRILDLSQINFDRLFQIEFGFKEKEYILISELFGKGNLVLCDSALEILGVLKREVWRLRELLPHKKYLPPPTKLSPFISFEEFQRHGIEREKDLANKFNLGGIYAREIFLRAESNDPKALYKAMHSFEKKPNIAGERVLPYDLIIFKDEKKEYFESFTEAADEFYGRRKGLEFLETQREALSKRERILESQKRMMEEFQKKRKEYKRKAELLYENYTLVETLLNNLKE